MARRVVVVLEEAAEAEEEAAGAEEEGKAEELAIMMNLTFAETNMTAAFVKIQIQIQIQISDCGNKRASVVMSVPSRNQRWHL